MYTKNVSRHSLRHHPTIQALSEPVCIYCMSTLDSKGNDADGSTHLCAETLLARQPAAPTPYN